MGKSSAILPVCRNKTLAVAPIVRIINFSIIYAHYLFIAEWLACEGARYRKQKVNKCNPVTFHDRTVVWASPREILGRKSQIGNRHTRHKKAAHDPVTLFCIRLYGMKVPLPLG